MLHQGQQILFMFAKWWQMNVKHIQSEVEILSQMSLRHGLFRIFVCRREHAHIHRCFHFASQAADFVIWKIGSLEELGYWIGFNPRAATVRAGSILAPEVM